jgi:hypothetical protein
MEQRHAAAKRTTEDRDGPRGRFSLPSVTEGERDFWRRAVAAERRRQRCGRPAPFPFQPA